jgi:hypothetical protein
MRKHGSDKQKIEEEQQARLEALKDQRRASHKEHMARLDALGSGVELISRKVEELRSEQEACERMLVEAQRQNKELQEELNRTNFLALHVSRSQKGQVIRILGTMAGCAFASYVTGTKIGPINGGIAVETRVPLGGPRK